MSPASSLRALLQPRMALQALALASALILASAFALEHLGGLAPCPLCIWQRWPYVVAIALTALGLFVLPARPALLLLALVFVVGAGRGASHVAVEQGWVALPAACAAAGEAATTADLLLLLTTRPAPRCDQVAFTLAGLSLAGWNVITSIALTALALGSLRAAGRPGHCSSSRRVQASASTGREK